MLPGDRLVCALIKPLPIGSQFAKWPLHVTIVPWFRLDDNSAQLAAGLKRTLLTIKSFEAVVDGEVKFGPRKNRPAHLLESSLFEQIEPKVRRYLHKKRAWLVDETTKKQPSFRSHVTLQGDEHLQTGDSLSFDRLYIVEQKGNYKQIIASIGLSEGDRLEP